MARLCAPASPPTGTGGGLKLAMAAGAKDAEMANAAAANSILDNAIMLPYGPGATHLAWNATGAP